MDILEKLQQVLREAGTSKITKSAYDTAWVARLGELDQPLSNQSLNWLAENQLPDGSWGASAPLYYHDRIICTLAAMVALTRHGRRGQDRRQIERGQHALEKFSQGATRGLMADQAGPTMRFEMLMPTLLAEVESHNIIAHQDNNVLGRLTRQRRAKLAKLPKHAINRNGTLAFFAEMVGPYELQLLDVENLQEVNGSVAYSSAATAFFALYVHPDPAALAFLNKLAVNGGVPYTGPMNIFEHTRILWNTTLIGPLDDKTLALCAPSVEELKRSWNHHPQGSAATGVAAVGGLSLPDGDTTSMAYSALTHFGVPTGLESVLHYEESEHFRCFGLEVNPSISANAHILAALRLAGFEVGHSSVQKILRFLKQAQTGRSFWFDKWHLSPYYGTCHAIIASAGYADDLVTNAVEWIVNTQNEDGSWGFYAPSAEETAYCLQALAIWKRQGRNDEEVSTGILKQGAIWLEEHMDDPYPWLWIGKSLYCPELVVESAILSALMLVENI